MLISIMGKILVEEGCQQKDSARMNLAVKHWNEIGERHGRRYEGKDNLRGLNTERFASCAGV